MPKAALPPNEVQRLKTLRGYDVLDTPPESAFDDLTLLAAQICQVPIALISLVDENRQWFKSTIGMGATETSRDFAFCAHAILYADKVLEVRDARLDPRFADNPLVTAAPHIHFYTGAPLVAPDGLALGTLCVIDRVPRVLSAEQITALCALSRTVIAQLELRRTLAAHRRTEKQLQSLNVSLERKVETRTAELTSEIEERKAAEESLRLAASVYEASSEAIMITDTDNQIIAINPAFTKITGYVLEEVVGKDPSILKSGRHDEAFYQAMWHEINTTGYWQGEIWDQRKNGENYPKWLTINTVFNEDGTAQRRVAMFIDISQKREAEELIWHQANFDVLTELPNRQMFHDRLDQDIKKAHRARRPLALMLLDLDQFKEVNDTLGHDMGDILLKEVALRLASCVRESDTVARLGGDEFTILLGELADPGCVERVAQEILSKLTEPFQLGNQVVHISASIGITLYPEDGTEIEALLKNADQAMYAAKKQGRNRYSYFTPSMQHAVRVRMQIANDLRVALAGNQFWVAYQPIVELATGAIHKAEALLRWQHPKKGLISPTMFISIAEDTRLIIDIGDWVFREAAEQVKRWRKSLHPAFQISVNKSPVQFHSKDQIHLSWHDYLKKLGLPGQSITVEITEGLLLDANAHVREQLLEFSDTGIQISLDDFGTGYSAMAYLKKFDIDYLKIDQSFTRNLAPGSDDMALCEAIIVMAHALNIKVIAEGVETEEQKNLLATAGCDYAQGYLFSKPVSAEEFEKLLATS